MNLKRLSALAFAGTTATAALTLPGLVYTPAGVTTPVAAARPAPDENSPVRPHPVRVVAPPVNWWKVRNGDTLSGIAQLRYNTAAAWTLIYWANHKQIKWANRIQIGQRFYLPAYNGHPPAAPRMLGPAPPPQVTHQPGPYRASPHSYSPAGTYHPSGGMEACIITRESGGNSQVMNGTGHYGLYQFSASTWVASGGSPSSFGHASVAEQQQVFHNAVAARGYSDWAPYDGC